MASRFWSLCTDQSLQDLKQTRTQESWEVRVNLKGPPSLNALSDDILVEVFSYLDVEDILSLRSVSTHTCVDSIGCIDYVGQQVILQPDPSRHHMETLPQEDWAQRPAASALLPLLASIPYFL